MVQLNYNCIKKAFTLLEAYKSKKKWRFEVAKLIYFRKKAELEILMEMPTKDFISKFIRNKVASRSDWL
ncbi:hypothetical protein AYI70_g11624 [Smittium culicis]|uniref:Uncharacterized protein n=1 Tax=Smittium culicis TaxID=133412 RepID=A0A1R1X120_9FUNG|nr:hypothetical protein AYI70_g11624 [Smittium culicis]